MAGMLEGKSALVTGGGSGIGRATALAMAREGAWVAVADLSADAARETVAAIEALEGQAVAITADVAAADSAQAMVAAAVAAFGGLDCAFNNAGIAPAAADAGNTPVCDISPEAWDRLLAVNLTGVWHCMRAEVAQMRRQGGGAIVNTASIGGLVGLPGSSAYTASKHGVVGLTRVAAADYAAENIRVNAICPGYIETPMTAATMQRHGGRITARTPMRRFGTVEEIAEVVVFMCSDRASFVTGSAWTADGGYTAV